MTDIEFDILDELYFVKTFEAIQASGNYTSEELTSTLELLVQRGWVRIIDAQDQEVTVQFKITELTSFRFVATKRGLMAHNQI